MQYHFGAHNVFNARSMTYTLFVDDDILYSGGYITVWYFYY